MDFDILSGSPLFRGLTGEETAAALEGTPFRIRKFRAGTMISQSGEEVHSVMIVLSGTVKGEMVDDTGKVIKIEDIPAPGALAAAFIFGNRNLFPVNVIGISDGEILSIGKHEFISLLTRNEKILLNFLNMISNRSQFLSEKIRFLSFKSIKGKLAHYLLQRAGSASIELRLDMTHNDLADFFGVARPSVSRAIGEMKEEGLIEASGKRIRILDRAALLSLTRSR
jgi:CRP/FNR family transcriptional regulator, dissimilatory nitrate respiration regulator